MTNEYQRQKKFTTNLSARRQSTFQIDLRILEPYENAINHLCKSNVQSNSFFFQSLFLYLEGNKVFSFRNSFSFFFRFVYFSFFSCLSWFYFLYWLFSYFFFYVYLIFQSPICLFIYGLTRKMTFSTISTEVLKIVKQSMK